ncbi:hypothetical protein FOCC_FOCC005342, partial [Frankliniella occidentalis]
MEEYGDGQATANRMRKVDRALLQHLTCFLQDFKSETKILEGNSLTQPTMPYVLLAATSLRDHCEPADGDCRQIEVARGRCLGFLNDKFKPSMKAKVATFLWPDFKELVMLPQEERDEVQARVRALIAEPDEAAAAAAEDAPDADGPPSPKAPRLDLASRYNKYRVQAPPAAAQDEVEKYLRMSVSVPADQLLAWWKLM